MKPTMSGHDAACRAKRMVGGHTTRLRRVVCRPTGGMSGGCDRELGRPWGSAVSDDIAVSR